MAKAHAARGWLCDPKSRSLIHSLKLLYLGTVAQVAGRDSWISTNSPSRAGEHDSLGPYSWCCGAVTNAHSTCTGTKEPDHSALPPSRSLSFVTDRAKIGDWKCGNFAGTLFCGQLALGDVERTQRPSFSVDCHLERPKKACTNLLTCRLRQFQLLEMSQTILALATNLAANTCQDLAAWLLSGAGVIGAPSTKTWTWVFLGDGRDRHFVCRWRRSKTSDCGFPKTERANRNRAFRTMSAARGRRVRVGVQEVRYWPMLYDPGPSDLRSVPQAEKLRPSNYRGSLYVGGATNLACRNLVVGIS